MNYNDDVEIVKCFIDDICENEIKVHSLDAVNDINDSILLLRQLIAQHMRCIAHRVNCPSDEDWRNYGAISELGVVVRSDGWSLDADWHRILRLSKNDIIFKSGIGFKPSKESVRYPRIVFIAAGLKEDRDRVVAAESELVKLRLQRNALKEIADAVDKYQISVCGLKK